MHRPVAAQPAPFPFEWKSPALHSSALVTIDLLAVNLAPDAVLRVLVGGLLGLGAAEAPAVGIGLALALLACLVLAGASQVHDLRHVRRPDYPQMSMPRCAPMR